MDVKKRIKHRLLDLEMTEAELISAVKEKTGMYCDYKVLARFYTGKNVSAHIKSAINEILGLLDCN